MKILKTMPALLLGLIGAFQLQLAVQLHAQENLLLQKCIEDPTYGEIEPLGPIAGYPMICPEWMTMKIHGYTKESLDPQDLVATLDCGRAAYSNATDLFYRYVDEESWQPMNMTVTVEPVTSGPYASYNYVEFVGTIPPMPRDVECFKFYCELKVISLSKQASACFFTNFGGLGVGAGNGADGDQTSAEQTDPGSSSEQLTIGSDSGISNGDVTAGSASPNGSFGLSNNAAGGVQFAALSA